MIVLIGMLVGIYDLGAIILIFGINAMMNLFGLLMELHNQTTQKTDWTSFIFGSIAGDHSMDCDRTLLRRIAYKRRWKATYVCICDYPNIVRLF